MALPNGGNSSQARLDRAVPGNDIARRGSDGEWRYPIPNPVGYLIDNPVGYLIDNPFGTASTRSRRFRRGNHQP
jgi:hypothetical protein